MHQRLTQMVTKISVMVMLSFLTTIGSAKEVVMAFSQDIPPYIFQQYNKGIEIDIIAAALAVKGHTLKPLYFPLGRIPIAFISKLTDAAMGDMGIDLTKHQGFYAEPAVVYDNVFITLKERNIVIHKPEDLAQLTVVSFQGAEHRYPDWLSKVVENGKFYGISNQLTQVKLLALKRYDVVLSDRYIFKYFVKQLQLINEIETLDIDEHRFVDLHPEDYRPVFREPMIRDDFNQGLRAIKASGKFQQIYDNYLK